MLEPVHERDDDTGLDRGGIDALDRLLELVCLDGHEQDVNGLRELLAHLGAQEEWLSAFDLERDAGEREDADHVRTRNADGVHSPVQEAHGQGAANGAWA